MSLDSIDVSTAMSGYVCPQIYGDGTYFARDAKYSDDYALKMPGGQKKMIVAEVVVGKWVQGKKGMKLYPLLPGEKFKCISVKNSLRKNDD